MIGHFAILQMLPKYSKRRYIVHIFRTREEALAHYAHGYILEGTFYKLPCCTHVVLSHSYFIAAK